MSIIARGRAGGYTLKTPVEDKKMHSRTEFIEEMAVLLAGFLTEKIIFGEPTTGATSDLRHATNLARQLVTDYGMSEKLGPRTFGEKEEMIFLGKEIHERRDYSEKTAEEIDKEIAHFIDQAMHLAQGVIRQRHQILEKVANRLLEMETLEHYDFEKLVGPKPRPDKNLL